MQIQNALSASGRGFKDEKPTTDRRAYVFFANGAKSAFRCFSLTERRAPPGHTSLFR